MKREISGLFKSTSARLTLFVLVLGIALVVGRGACAPRSGIALKDYEVARDYKQAIELFERNRYWLTADPKSPVEYSFSTLSPNKDPRYRGTMTIKVLRNNGDLVGFIAYYMKSPVFGFVLYVAVDERYRGKKLADKLMKHALDDLISRGAQRIELITRPTNISAQRVYERIGFHELGRDNTYVFYEYRP